MNHSSLFLRHIAYKLRTEIVQMTTRAGSGHPTTACTLADMIAVLFLEITTHADDIVLSSGHAVPVIYAVYAVCGKISVSELAGYRTFGSVLEGHPTPRFPFIAQATGSLGQGLSIGLGKALMYKRKDCRGKIFVIMGDSEFAEGSNWEACAVAAQYKTHELVAVINCDSLGQSTTVLQGMQSDGIVLKMNAFGWHTFICDGHDVHALEQALTHAREYTAGPSAVVMKTVKGFGLPNAGKQGYHGKPFSQQELPAVLDYLAQRAGEAAVYEGSEVAMCPVMQVHKQLSDQEPDDAYAFYCTPQQYGFVQPEKPLATRYAYGHALAHLGAQYEKMIVFDAEVKNSTYAELFEKAYPENFYQAFIAEQNMVGMALGVAVMGYIPFASTFAAFMTRAYDQIRMAALSRAPVRLCGSHAGVSIGQDGPSQMGLEDIAMMRTIPHSVIFYPCDAVSTYACVQLMIQYTHGVSYLRTTRSQTPQVYQVSHTFYIGGCTVLQKSEHDVTCIIAAGITVFEALQAYQKLADEGLFVCVIDCYSIKPLPYEELYAQAVRCHKKVITVEDHYRSGGLGEAVSAALADKDVAVRSLAVDKIPRSGQPQELLTYQQIDAQAIIAAVHRIIHL